MKTQTIYLETAWRADEACAAPTAAAAAALEALGVEAAALLCISVRLCRLSSYTMKCQIKCQTHTLSILCSLSCQNGPLLTVGRISNRDAQIQG